MNTILDYQKFFINHLEKRNFPEKPENLYQPVQYILSLGGKRLRPILVLMSTEIFGSSREEAIDAALAVEIFHNFSLIHDDIMDAAPLRRGKETVHTKWDINTGILSGDVMLIYAYQLFERYDGGIFKNLSQLFTKTAIEVCEGQQYDMDFEVRDDVSIAEYLRMIEYKTAVLVGAALEMGAIVAGASAVSRKAIYDFGRLLGLAFQLQDDYLDAFGDPLTFGKQVGGDIIENKKTYLYLKALENASVNEVKQLQGLFSLQPKNSAEKIETVKKIFESTQAKEQTRIEIENYTKKAFEVLDKIDVSQSKKEILINFGKQLMNREM